MGKYHVPVNHEFRQFSRRRLGVRNVCIKRVGLIIGFCSVVQCPFWNVKYLMFLLYLIVNLAVPFGYFDELSLKHIKSTQTHFNCARVLLHILYLGRRGRRHCEGNLNIYGIGGKGCSDKEEKLSLASQPCIQGTNWKHMTHCNPLSKTYWHTWDQPRIWSPIFAGHA